MSITFQDIDSCTLSHYENFSIPIAVVQQWTNTACALVKKVQPYSILMSLLYHI